MIGTCRSLAWLIRSGQVLGGELTLSLRYQSSCVLEFAGAAYSLFSYVPDASGPGALLQPMAAIGQTLYFGAFDGTAAGLWKTNGSPGLRGCVTLLTTCGRRGLRDYVTHWLTLG